MQPSKSNFPVLFGMDLVGAGGIWLPRLLTQNYTRLGISDKEMIALIHILSLKEGNNVDFGPNEVARHMEADTGEVAALLESLNSKGIIKIETGLNIVEGRKSISVSLGGLYERLFEIWGCNKALEFEKKKDSQNRPDESQAVANLYCSFEKEFGRPLSPIESTQIIEWFYDEGYPEKLILEALKRSVLRGVVNFKYIDSILRGWKKKNLKTMREIETHEEGFLKRRKNASKEKAPKKSVDKYKDIYIS